MRSGRTVVDQILNEVWRLQVLHTDPAEQPWNTLTSTFAAYEPYLAGGSEATPETAAPPRRSRLEERKFGQSRRFGRRRAEHTDQGQSS